MTTINSIIARAVVNNLNRTTEELNASILNLASGIKSNAGVADFSVGTILQYNSSSLTAANVNAGQGKSLLQTAKGALDEILELVQEVKDLAVQAADDSLTDNERANLNIEAQALITEIDRLADTTNFNNKNLIDGTISGNAALTSATGQGAENYTLLDTTQYSFSGTVATGELDETTPFAAITSTNIGATAGTATLTFTTAGMTGDATLQIGGGAGDDIVFGDGAADGTDLATAFVAAARAHGGDYVRQFVFTDNEDGTVTVTSADLGNAADTTSFELTDDNGGEVSGLTFGSGGTPSDITGGPFSFDTASGGTIGTTRADPSTATVDANLEGSLTNFTASLDTTNTYNEVTFTVEVNGTTYTSQAVQLFGTGGFNTLGNTIKSEQVITFYNTAGPQDGSDVYTDNGFTLTVGDTDITINDSGDQTSFETDLANTIAGFETQLADTSINQSRDVVLPEVNAVGGDHEIDTSVGTIFDGIISFDAEGGNTRGDIQFVGDTFGDAGLIGDIGNFSFTSATNTLSVTIDGVVYSADLSDSEDTESAGTTKGLINGTNDGGYNSTTKVLTSDNTDDTIIIFHSATSGDGKQLRIELDNLTDKSINLGTAAEATAFTDDLDTIFGVDTNQSLSFQVGSGSTNTIGVSLDSAKSTDIFLDDAGTSKTIDISTVAGATAAQDILDNAIDNVLSIISDASSSITSFNSAITTNSVMIQNFDAASSSLLNTDYALESTLFAEATLRINSAVSVLAQEQVRLQNLLQLISV